GGGNRDQRRADSDASRAVRKLRRQLIVTEEEVRIAEIVHQVWAEDAGGAKQALIGPRPFVNPIRREGVGDGASCSAGRREVAGAVVRVAQEKCVPARKAVIQSKAELVFQQRGGGDAAEVSEIPEQRGARDSPLIVTFPVGKEEQAVAADRAAEREAVLLP